MKQYSLLVFFLILFISQATNFRTSDISLIENLRKTDFGRTLLKSIQVQLKAKNGHPVTSILDLVNKIKAEIEAEQTEKQSEYETEKADCASVISELESDVDTDQSTIDDNNKQIMTIQNQIDSYNGDAQATSDSINLMQTQVDTLSSIRDQENQAYQAESQELKGVIQALKDGKSILQQLIASGTSTGAFFEKNRILVKPNKNDLKNMVFLLQSKENGYMKLGSILFEMLSKQEGDVDQSLLNNVLEIIDNLINQLMDNLQTKSETEADRESTYENEKANLLASLTTLQSQLASIQSSIKALQDQLLNLQEDNNMLDDKIKQMNTDKDAKEGTCTDYYHGYVTESQNRSNELDILEKIIEIFQTRFDKVDDYIKDLTL